MNYKLFFFASALNLFYYVPYLLASPIIGGEEDRAPNTYKYHVSIQSVRHSRIPNSRLHICGGTIIHNRYILSAADCFVLVDAGHLTAIYPKRDGIVVVSGTSETYGTQGIITHVHRIFIPKAYSNGHYADISVLELRTSLDVEHNTDRLEILPIYPSHQSVDYENKNAFILGNGYDTLVGENEELRASNRRRILEVYVTSRDACPEYYYAICVKSRDTSSIHTISTGDSGSPLVFDNTVIGVASLSVHDMYNMNPIKCTRTWRSSGFITNAMQEDGDHSNMYIFYY